MGAKPLRMTFSVVECSDGIVSISAAVRVILPDFPKATPFLSSRALLLHRTRGDNPQWANLLGEFIRDRVSEGRTVTHSCLVPKERTIVLGDALTDASAEALLDLLGPFLEQAYGIVMTKLLIALHRPDRRHKLFTGAMGLSPHNPSSPASPTIQFLQVRPTRGENENFLFEVAGIQSPGHITSPWPALVIADPEPPHTYYPVVKDSQEYRLVYMSQGMV